MESGAKVIIILLIAIATLYYFKFILKITRIMLAVLFEAVTLQRENEKKMKNEKGKMKNEKGKGKWEMKNEKGKMKKEKSRCRKIPHEKSC